MKTAGGARRAWVLHLRPRSPEPETWTEELWIDTERNVVLTSIFRDAAPRGSMPPRTRTIAFERVELAAPDPSLFTWAPPRGARQVDRFQQSRVPNGPNPQP